MSVETEVSQRAVYVVYDKECPMCANYCQMVRLREAAGEVVLVDAREPSPLMERISKERLDIDQGMVVVVNNIIYYGSDAIHALSLMSSQVGLFNKFTFWLFRSKRRAKTLYPLLRGCRNLVLKLLGRSKINNLNRQNNDKF